MIATLRQRNFALVWCGGLISLTGDFVLFFALPYHVYHLTGSVLSTGLMFIAGTLPGVLFGSVAGVFVDRWDRKRTMIVASTLQGLCLLLLFLASSVEWLWVVYLVSFIEAVIAQFFSPAERALLPQLVSKEHLIAANSLNGVNGNASMLLGPAIGGGLFALWGLNSIIIFDSTSFFVAALLIAFISWSPQQAEGEAGPFEIKETSGLATAAWKSVWREWLEGLQLVKSNRMVIAIFISAGIANLSEAILVVLLIPFVNIISGGALILGLLLTLRGLGGLLGGYIVGKAGDLWPATLIYPMGLCATGVLCLIMYNIPVLYVSMACLFCIGIPAMGAGVGSLTLLQNSVAEHFRGRVFGVWATTVSLVIILGQVGASSLGDRVGIIPMLNVSGILYVLSGLVAFLMISRIRNSETIPKTKQM